MLDGERRPPPALSRKDIDLPDWVETAMITRWFAIGIGVVLYWITESYWVIALSMLVFFAVGHIVYRLYRKEDPVSAEIAFHNENDGYHSGGEDGDGDGGD